MAARQVSLPRRIFGSLFLAALFTYGTMTLLAGLGWLPPSTTWRLVIAAILFIILFAGLFVGFTSGRWIRPFGRRIRV